MLCKYTLIYELFRNSSIGNLFLYLANFICPIWWDYEFHLLKNNDKISFVQNSKEKCLFIKEIRIAISHENTPAVNDT